MDMRFLKTADQYYVAPTAIVVGDVTAGAGSSIWFGAVIRGDVAPIRLGLRVNVQDNCVIHCDSGVENVIGNDVTIGHSAIVHGASIGDGTLIGMGAKVLGKTVIGKECLIAAGAVVSPGMVVPDRCVVMGLPGKVVRPVREAEFAYMKWLSQHYEALAGRYHAGEFAEKIGLCANRQG